MRIALATCSKLPDWEVDDRPLHAAFAALGVDLAHPVWDDPDFDWSTCDACLVRTTWDYMERREAFVAWAERVAERTRLFNPADVLHWNTHKAYLRQLAKLGVPTIPTIWLDGRSSPGLQRLLAERGWQHAFLKPQVGATARETLRFQADADGLERAEDHLRRILPQEGMMLQPYLSSVEREGEISAIVFDGRISHVVRKIPLPGDYRVQDEFGASDRPEKLTVELEGLVERALRVLDRDLLYARVDALRTDAGELLVNELELVEPSLFFRHAPRAGRRLAEGLLARLRQG